MFTPSLHPFSIETEQLLIFRHIFLLDPFLTPCSSVSVMMTCLVWSAAVETYHTVTCRHHGAGVCQVWSTWPLFEEKKICFSELETWPSQTACICSQLPGERLVTLTWLNMSSRGNDTTLKKKKKKYLSNPVLFSAGGQEHHSWKYLCQKPFTGQRRGPVTRQLSFHQA